MGNTGTGRKAELTELSWRLEGFENRPGFDVTSANRSQNGLWELTVQPLDRENIPEFSWLVRTLEGYVPYDVYYSIMYAERLETGGWRLRLKKEERKEERKEDGQE